MNPYTTTIRKLTGFKLFSALFLGFLGGCAGMDGDSQDSSADSHRCAALSEKQDVDYLTSGSVLQHSEEDGLYYVDFKLNDSSVEEYRTAPERVSSKVRYECAVEEASQDASAFKVLVSNARTGVILMGRLRKIESTSPDTLRIWYDFDGMSKRDVSTMVGERYNLRLLTFTPGNTDEDADGLEDFMFLARGGAHFSKAPDGRVWVEVYDVESAWSLPKRGDLNPMDITEAAQRVNDSSDHLNGDIALGHTKRGDGDDRYAMFVVDSLHYDKHGRMLRGVVTPLRKGDASFFEQVDLHDVWINGPIDFHVDPYRRGFA